MGEGERERREVWSRSSMKGPRGSPEPASASASMSMSDMEGCSCEGRESAVLGRPPPIASLESRACERMLADSSSILAVEGVPRSVRKRLGGGWPRRGEVVGEEEL